MDCEKLKADIQSLRDAQAAFEDAVNAANETGLGNTKCKEALGRASELEDAILEGYLDDFCEKNPETFDYEFSGEVEGLSDLKGKLLVLSDDELLECGNFFDGIGVRIYQRQDDGSYEVAQEFGENTSLAIGSLMSNGDVFLKNDRRGVIYGSVLRKKNDGGYELEALNDTSGQLATGECFVPLRDGGILVWNSGHDGDGSSVTVYRRNGEDGSSYMDVGHSVISQETDSMGALVSAMTELSNGDILVSGYNGEWGTLRRENNDSDSGLSLPFEEFSYQAQDAGEFGSKIRYTFELSDGNYMFGTGAGEFGVFHREADGSYSPVEDVRSLYAEVGQVIQRDNGDVLVLKKDGSVLPYKKKYSGSYGFAMSINEEDSLIDPKVSCIHSLPNGRIVAATDRGLYYVQMDENGEYSLSEGINEGLSDFISDSVKEMADLPNGDVLVRSQNDRFGLLHGGVPSLELLKERLESIANKTA